MYHTFRRVGYTSLTPLSPFYAPVNEGNLHFPQDVAVLCTRQWGQYTLPLHTDV